MDFMKEFEQWLPTWAEKNKQPIPTKKHMDKWNLAWYAFIKEVLNERWDEISSDYRSMRYKTEADIYNEKQKQLVQQETPEQEEIPIETLEETLSEWEKVKKYLK